MIVPNHLAVIVDGNRRWARKNGLPVSVGHREGAKKLIKFIKWCLELKIPQISVYALSLENLEKRSKKEINDLFDLFMEYFQKLERDPDILDKYEVRVRFFGDFKKLPPALVKIMKRIMAKTAKYQKKILNILIAYSSYFELTHVINKIVKKIINSGKIQISKKDVQNNLLISTPVDLVIRTGGYSRLSNFLLLQSAYAELYVVPKLWPDFTKNDLVKAIKWYNSVERKFGK